MSRLRFDAVEAASARRPVETVTSGRPDEYFGCKVFDKVRMQEYLDSHSFKEMASVMDGDATPDQKLTVVVADALKRWAIDNGVRHYTHWFSPLTGTTAEKHDNFIEFDGSGSVIENFSSELLTQQEPDASSFPNGGIRSTFEARGYSAWDPTSPAFIINDTLCIPTVFISYTGEALDYKSPLLKSLNAIDKAATRVCRFFDEEIRKVNTYLGWEQEYFLIDEALFTARPDLVLTGRTLMGHESAKNQQLNDHYFGSIPERVANFMQDLETEAHKLGIPAKTCHNEAAPNQFELAPIYETCNLAVDHNMMLMSLMKSVAVKHKFRVLLHEKPFKGINGSGKHCNWSLGTDKGIMLMKPGKNDKENLRFITFVVNSLAAIYRHNGLIKASIMNAANEHRLGAHEAPPAIISSFLGTELSSILDRIEAHDDLVEIVGRREVRLNIPQIPEIFLDNTDRNRTSPFAFTGNRFEFRAVGSEANCASAMTVLNTAMAEQLELFADDIDKLVAEGESQDIAIVKVLRKYIKYSKAIRFDGNGYSEEWVREASERGLDCCGSSPLLYDRYLDKESVSMFHGQGVMDESELRARNEIKWSTYTKKIQIEGRVLGDMALNHIIPIATKYQSSLLDNVIKMEQVLGKKEGDSYSLENIESIKHLAGYVAEIRRLEAEMINRRKAANAIDSEREKAIAYHDTVKPMLESIRAIIDKIELMVDDELWTLPKYRELLSL